MYIHLQCSTAKSMIHDFSKEVTQLVKKVPAFIESKDSAPCHSDVAFGLSNN